MTWGHAHGPRFSYRGDRRPAGVFSYSPMFWRHQQRGARADEDKKEEADAAAMKAAVYVGVGVAGAVGIAALVWMAAKRS